VASLEAAAEAELRWGSLTETGPAHRSTVIAR
jgi:hypothetical protein